MEGLIPVVNRLQDVFSSVGQKTLLDLPQIVVIGSQSSGKSSVLESVLGKNFLPRAAGICTRRPLVLQLYQNQENEEEWAEFLHIPNRRFVDFEQVRREIEIETDRETGRNKGMSSKAIRLKVHSPHVLNLTLVDLPGITKVPVGDQPDNVEELTRDMCLEYISNPLSIILAVSPANSDLANSEALKLAKEMDPSGDRTIGILTKLDLVDDGVDVVDALNGNVIPLKRGYVGIINRSQAEVNANTPIHDVRKKERAFFLNHPAYRSIASRQGIEYLSKTLNAILLHHIREHLPDIKANVQKQLREIERELAVLGNDAVDTGDRTAQGQLILTLINKYCNAFVDSMEGRQTPDEGLESMDTAGAFTVNGGLYGGARISRAFKTYSSRLLAISPFQDLCDGEIGTAITNATGPRPSLFVPELSFEMLVKRQLSHLQEPAMNCVLDVYEILQEVAEQSCFAGLSRFRALQEHVLDSVNSMLSKSLLPTQTMIENLIKVEKAFINTSHPDFMARLQAIRGGGDYHDSFQHQNHNGGMQTPDLVSANKLHSSDSSSSVASFTSEPANNLRELSNGTDLENLNLQDGTENGNLNAANGSSEDGASSDDDQTTSKREQQKTTGRSNFMSFIFNERVTTSSASRSVPSTKTPLFHQKRVTNNSSSASPSLLPLSTAFGARAASALLPDSAHEKSEANSQIRIIKRLIECYLAISRKNVLDLTPKTIMFFLVNDIKENIHTELIRALYQEQLFTKLLQESEEVAQTRQNYRETAKLLTRALGILSSVREFKLT